VETIVIYAPLLNTFLLGVLIVLAGRLTVRSVEWSAKLKELQRDVDGMRSRSKD